MYVYMYIYVSIYQYVILYYLDYILIGPYESEYVMVTDLDWI